MKKHFPVIIEMDKNGVYIVSCPVIQGCHSYGHTIDEAMDNIKEAILVSYDEDQSGAKNAFIGIRDLEMAVL